MAKLNQRQPRTQSTGPIQAATTSGGAKTHEGTPGYGRDPQSELFLMAVGAFAGEGSFYEDEEKRTERYTRLVEACMFIDPWWVAGLLKYLRQTAKMRTASILGAGIGARWAARNDLAGWARPVLREVLQRPDEPGEFLAWWRLNAKTTVNGGVLRGLQEAVVRLYDERSLIKYDGENQAYRFGDVIELVHPRPATPVQRALFRYAIDRRHARAVLHTDELLTVRGYRALQEMPVDARRALLSTSSAMDVFAAAGMTWENASAWNMGPLTAGFWEALIPRMRPMALVRNLRNFDAAGISPQARANVARRLEDADEMGRSGILPFQLYAAYKNVLSDNWAAPLATALDHAVANIPELTKRTLILVDCSGSMVDKLSRRSQLSRMDAAKLFGAALALRAEAPTLVAFGTSSHEVEVKRGMSIGKLLVPSPRGFRDMGGTETDRAIQQHYAGHDRVILLTDEQASWGYGLHGFSQRTEYTVPVPNHVPVHIWNFAGYEHGMAPATPNQYWWGGMTDDCFRLIPQVEAGRAVGWDMLVPSLEPLAGLATGGVVTRKP